MRYSCQAIALRDQRARTKLSGSTPNLAGVRGVPRLRAARTTRGECLSINESGRVILHVL